MKPNAWESLMGKFHELRSSIKDPSSGAFPRVVTVVSAGDGEGKSTVAGCLAMSLARLDQRVAVVDLNFRTPGLCEFFSRPRATGVTDVLTGKAPLEEVVQDVSGVHVVCTGMATVNDPLELLESPGMGELLETLKKNYSVVIIDTPSLSEHKDGVVIARYADFVIYVIARGRTSRERVKETIGLLGNQRIGIVLNRDRG